MRNITLGSIAFIVLGLFILINLGIRQILELNTTIASKSAGYMYLISGGLMIGYPILDLLNLPRWFALLILVVSVCAFIIATITMIRHSKRSWP